MDVISEMMGVPEADRAEVRRLADLVVHREDGVYDVPPAGDRGRRSWLVGYYQDMVDQRRRTPTDDLTSALHRRRRSTATGSTDEEIIAFLFLMVVAGNETTTKLLGHALFHLTRHPDQLARVFDGPDAELVDAVDRGDAALRHLEPAARPPPARATSSCTARSRRRARSCCSASARPTATSGSSPPRRLRHRPRQGRARPDPVASAAAGTSASAPTWPGSRPGSR